MADTASGGRFPPIRLSGFVGIPIGLGLLILAFRRADLSEVWLAMSSARLQLLFLAALVGLVENLVRAHRWKSLFSRGSRTRLRPLYTSMMIGYLANNFLPARMGEIVRIYVFGMTTGHSKSAAAATVVLERMADLLVLLCFTGIACLWVPIPREVRIGLSIGGFLLAAVAAATIAFATHAGKGGALPRFIARLIPTRWQPRVLHILEQSRAGLSMLRNARQAGEVATFTIVIWLLAAASVAMVMVAMRLDLPYGAALFVAAVLSLSFVIPTAPGAVGTYEFFVALALSSFAVKRGEGLAFALVLPAVVYISSTIQGIVCLTIEGLSLHQIVAASRRGFRNHHLRRRETPDQGLERS